MKIVNLKLFRVILFSVSYKNRIDFTSNEPKMLRRRLALQRMTIYIMECTIRSCFK